MKETERMKKAFELYNNLGEGRSYDKVSMYMGLTTRNVERWGSEFKWQERLEQREKERKEKYKSDYEDLAAVQLKIKLEIAKKYLKNIEDLDKVQDYKEYMGIVGEPDFAVLGIVENVDLQSACATSDIDKPPDIKIVKPDGCDDDG